MKCRESHIGKYQILLLLGIFSMGFGAKSQVDQRWLNSWNEAYKMKPSKITSTGRIAPMDEEGIPLVIEGKVYNPDDTYAQSILVHCYHRDSKGYDFGKNDSELDTWRLQGWAKTDHNGNFTFKTIRPAADHIGREGPHLHFIIISNKYGRQWAPKVFLSDDSSLTENQRNNSKKAGKFGWIVQVNEKDGVQYISVNIRLKERGDF